MGQALAVELGGYQPMQVFVNFYSMDLIAFGMEHNIPEAVRLGEKMLSQNQFTLPKEIAKAVKQYKLQNNAKYNDAMKRTGPINTQSVYLNSRPVSDEYASNSIVNMDDPYWQNFYKQNYRAQDHYKLPSALAWDFKQGGIIGEIVDLKELQRKQA